MEMCYWKIFAIIGIFTVLLDSTIGMPKKEIIREKRTSDQRLAELETLFALSKMHGKFVTVPIGFGKIDPSKLGRRRRSIGLLIRKLMNRLSDEEVLSREILKTVVEPSDYLESQKIENFLLDDSLNLVSRDRNSEKLPD